MTVLAQDSFTEASDTPLESHVAEIGGQWHRVTGTSGATVSAALGVVIRGAGGSTAHYQPGSVVLGDGDIYSTLPLVIGGIETHVFARYIDANNFYRLSFYWDIGVEVWRKSGGTLFRVIQTYPDIPYADFVRIRWQITGSSPTAHKVRYWDAAGAEPGTWPVNTTDNTAGNQTASACPVGVMAPIAGDGMTDDFLVVTAAASIGEATTVTFVGAPL